MAARMIESRYGGECARCGAVISLGDTIWYAKRGGVHCLECGEHTDDEIRERRTARADARADQLRNKAARLTNEATAVLDKYAYLRDDHAFMTQPGHVPFRAKVNDAEDRAYGKLTEARNLEATARHIECNKPLVKGDTERKYAEQDAAAVTRLAVGMKVHCHFYGDVTVRRINAKSVTVETVSGFRDRMPARWLKPISA